MELLSYLNFTKDLQTHALFVGVILTLEAIMGLLISVTLDVNLHDPCDELKQLEFTSQAFLVIGVLHILSAIVFLVGFLKRQCWCLTLCVGLIAVNITLHFLGLLVAMIELKIVFAYVMLIVLVVKAYFLLVTLQLREVNSDYTRQQNEISAKAKIRDPACYVAAVKHMVAEL